MNHFILLLWTMLLCLQRNYFCFASATIEKGRHECPICYRVIHAAKGLAKTDNIKASMALDRFCALKQGLEVSDEKFCYDTENVRGTINRLLDLFASAERICKKIKDMNPDFCRQRETLIRRDVPVDGMDAIVIKDKKRGIIFE